MPEYESSHYGIEHWISFLVVGIMAAFFVGYLKRGRGFGWLGNVIVGVLGATIGPFLYSFVPERFDVLSSLPSISLGDLIIAMIGAFVMLFLVRFVKDSE